MKQGLEVARDHEMLELEGTPQDIVDFRRKHVPALIFHACPECGEEMILGNQLTLIELENMPLFAGNVKLLSHQHYLTWLRERLSNGTRITIIEDKAPRNPVPPKPAGLNYSDVSKIIQKDLDDTNQSLMRLLNKLRQAHQLVD